MSSIHTLTYVASCYKC